MGVPRDYSGRKYGLLTALQMMGHRGKGRQWLFQCACGNACVKAISDVVKEAKLGRTPSCGCYSHFARGQCARKHGYSGHPLYHIWVGMRQRCRDQNMHGYRNYGGRGISVCERWQNCQNFFDDMLPTWKPGMSIDRIDTNGNYEPSNCRWATPKEQCRNKRDNHIVCGVTVTELAERCGVDRGTLYARIRAGIPTELLTTPVGKLPRRIKDATESAA